MKKGQALLPGLAVLALALLPASAHAQSLDEIKDSCSNEIQLACHDDPQGRAALLKCLKRHEDALTQRCADLLHSGAAVPSAAVPSAAEDESGDDEAMADDEREARLTTVSGSVYLHTSEQKEGEFITAEAGAPVEEGDMVRTGTDGSAELTLDGESVISVAANTDFIVNSLSPKETEFHLGIGSLVAKIKSIFAGQKFTFRTPTAVAAIRGTELGLEQEAPDKPARIGVFDEGHVAVSSPKGGKEIMLSPGQETEVHAGKAPIQARPLKTFLTQKKSIEQVRQRVQTVRKDWVRATPQARRDLRAKLTQRPVLQAGKLKNVRESQRKMTHAGNQKRQEKLWKNRPNRSEGGRRGGDDRRGGGTRRDQRQQHGASGQRGPTGQHGQTGPRGSGGQQGPQGQNGPHGTSGPGGGRRATGPGGPQGPSHPGVRQDQHRSGERRHRRERGKEEGSGEGSVGRSEHHETRENEHREQRHPPVRHGPR